MDPRDIPHSHGSIGERRRALLGTLGGAALGMMAPSLFARGLAAPSPIVQDAEPLVLALGRLGPRLIAAGAIDPERFIEACRRSGAPVNAESRRLLTEGAGGAVALEPGNAHFLLNFLWAFGLANTNRLLTRGPIFAKGMSQIPGYASTGGWTLGSRPAMEVYAHLPLVSLTEAQQSRLEEVSSNVFRPCCDNPTSFPDCNHGMAMVGLLTVLAAEGRDADALYVAAKRANAAWFPGQSRQLAAYAKVAMGVDYRDLDPRAASGRRLFSGSGFGSVASWLKQRGLSAPAPGARC